MNWKEEFIKLLEAGAIIREIIETEKCNFRIIYTVEDVDADKPFGI